MEGCGLVRISFFPRLYIREEGIYHATTKGQTMDNRRSSQKYFSWHKKMKIHIERVAKKFLNKPTHGKILTTLLQDCAAQMDELFNHTHTRVLEKHPTIPVRFFSNAIQVPYRVGLKRYKFWHNSRGIKPPLTGRTSAEARTKWLQIVLEEIVTK